MIHSTEIICASKFYNRGNFANRMAEWYESQVNVLLLWFSLMYITVLISHLLPQPLSSISPPSYPFLLQPCCNFHAIHTYIHFTFFCSLSSHHHLDSRLSSSHYTIYSHVSLIHTHIYDMYRNTYREIHTYITHTFIQLVRIRAAAVIREIIIEFLQ